MVVWIQGLRFGFMIRCRFWIPLSQTLEFVIYAEGGVRWSVEMVYLTKCLTTGVSILYPVTFHAPPSGKMKEFWALRILVCCGVMLIRRGETHFLFTCHRFIRRIEVFAQLV